jgi:N-acetylmuramoyl-L-alanine amidase
MKIITRKEWGARAARGVIHTAWGSRTRFVTHYSSADREQSVRAIQNFHMDTRGWVDIGYNFLVDYHGNIFEGRGWDTIGAHAQGHNTESIGVCHIGKNGDHTMVSLRSIRWLYDLATVRGGGRALRMNGHRDVGSTDCPGDLLEAWVKSGMHVDLPTPVPGSTPHPLLEDGVLGPNTTRLWQHVMHTPEDGIISDPSKLVAAVQVHLNEKISAGLVIDGVGIRQDGRVYKTTRALQRYLDSGTDGLLSVPVSGTIRVLQRRLNAGEF